MRTVIALAPLLLSAAVSAQQPKAPEVRGPEIVARQPIVRQALAADDEPTSLAKGWALDPAAAVSAGVPGVVSHGPGARITAPSDMTVFRPEWSLAGEFSISAVFEAKGSASGSYGLTVGGALGLAFLVRPDGTFVVHHLQGAKRTEGRWSPRLLDGVAGADPAATRLEVRVGPTEAAFVINGVVVSAIPVAAGQLDGAPGVHVAAQGDVTVAGFTVHTTSAQFPGAGK